MSDRDRQLQMDISSRNRCRWTSIDETEESETIEETEDMEVRLIFRIECKRLHEEEKNTKHGRQPSLYTQFTQLTYILILTFMLITVQLIWPSLIQLDPEPTPFPRSRHPKQGDDTLSTIEISEVR